MLYLISYQGSCYVSTDIMLHDTITFLFVGNFGVKKERKGIYNISIGSIENNFICSNFLLCSSIFVLSDLFFFSGHYCTFPSEHVQSLLRLEVSSDVYFFYGYNLLCLFIFLLLVSLLVIFSRLDIVFHRYILGLFESLFSRNKWTIKHLFFSFILL